MSDTITLTREELQEVRDDMFLKNCFLAYDPQFGCEEYQGYKPSCRLCKRLTLFAKGEEDG